MQLLLPPEIRQRLITALTKAAHREIGGILMGEHLAENVFRVKDLTIQRHGGGFAAFLRVVQDVVEPLRSFFRATNNDFKRFNYLGEWHSHPSFVPEPSTTDHETMQGIIEDPKVGAHFVILLVIKLIEESQLESSITVYQAGGRKFRGQLVQEEEEL